MFGESDSESPRVPSPWDSLTPISPTPTHDEILRRGIPKLIPENEEVSFPCILTNTLTTICISLFYRVMWSTNFI
jgi:hypothetical protein